MTLTTDELAELSPRQLGHLIENAGDALTRNEEATESMKSMGDIVAETGHKIVAVDGGRINYNSNE